MHGDGHSLTCAPRRAILRAAAGECRAKRFAPADATADSERLRPRSLRAPTNASGYIDPRAARDNGINLSIGDDFHEEIFHHSMNESEHQNAIAKEGDVTSYLAGVTITLIVSRTIPVVNVISLRLVTIA